MPGPDRSALSRLARTLPDVPRWVETRSMLLSGRCEVFGLEEEGPELRFVVCDPEERLVSVVGHPEEREIEEAVARNRNEGHVLVTPEDGDLVATALPGWTASPATLHLLGDAPQLPRVPQGTVRLLGPSELEAIDGLPPELDSQLKIAVGRGSSVAATMVGERPVSFCYVAAQTESLWDISISTLEEHSKQGYAARCGAYMIGHMQRRGKRPVWGAEDWNVASLRLAEKLGFVPVDRLLVFHSGEAFSERSPGDAR